MTLAAFATIIAIHLMAVMSPGPSFVLAIRTAASEGFRVAVPLAVGFGVGAVVWAGAALGGLALVFDILPQLFQGMKIIGGLFLLWIAYQIWRHAPDPLPDHSAQTTPRSSASAFRLGFLTFATNPKPAVFFGAVFVGVVPPDTPPLWLAAILAAIFVNETLWYIAVARIFSTRRARDAYGRAKIWVDRVFAGLIAAFGAKITLG